jgi:hypothetical protein
MKTLQSIIFVLLLSFLVHSFAIEVKQREYAGEYFPTYMPRSTSQSPCIWKICSRPISQRRHNKYKDKYSTPKEINLNLNEFIQFLNVMNGKKTAAIDEMIKATVKKIDIPRIFGR